MQVLLLLIVALMSVGCFNDSLRRTMLPNGYSLDTMGRRSGIIVRPDSPRSSSWKPVWPPLKGEREYCGAFGWSEALVVREVVAYPGETEYHTGRYAVLDTASGAVRVAGDRAHLVEMLRQASVEMPGLAKDYPSTEAIYFPELRTAV